MRALPTLPNEILVDIYASQSCVGDAHSLSATCRQFRQIWESISYSTIEQIVRQEIVCPDDALRLVDLQEKTQSNLEEPSICGRIVPPKRYLQARGLRLIHRNARIVRRTCYDIMESDVQFCTHRISADYPALPCCKSHPPAGLPHEQERAIQTTYFVQRYMLAHSDERLRLQYENEVNGMCPLIFVATEDFVYGLRDVWFKHWKKNPKISFAFHDLQYIRADEYSRTDEWCTVCRTVGDIGGRKWDVPHPFIEDDGRLYGFCEPCLMMNSRIPTGDAIWEVKYPHWYGNDTESVKDLQYEDTTEPPNEAP